MASSIQPVINVLNLEMGTIESNSNLSTRQLLKYFLERNNNAVSLLNRKDANFQSEVSGYGQIKSEFSALKSAVNKLTDPTLFSSYLTKITDSLGLYSRSIEAVADTTAQEGVYQITVQQLATNQVKTAGENVVVANANTNTAQYGQNGTKLNVSFNKYTQSADSYVQSIDFTVTLSATASLNDLVSSINSATGNTNSQYLKAETVTANTSNSQKLQISSTIYGDKGQFNISVTGDSADGRLTQLMNSLTESQAGQNAIVNINGSNLQSADNSAINNFIQGVVLTLNQADAENPLTLNIYHDPTNLNTAMNSFVGAFNNLVSSFTDAKNSSLSKDQFVMNTLSSYMSNFVSRTIDNNNYQSIKSLQNLGLSFNKDTQQVEFDNQTFANFVEQSSGQVSSFLKDQGKYGFNSQVGNFVEKLAGEQSYVYLRSLGVKNDIRDVVKQRYQTGDSEQIQNRLQNQLFELDSSLGRLQEFTSYLSLQSSKPTTQINNGILNLVEQSSKFLKNNNVLSNSTTTKSSTSSLLNSNSTSTTSLYNLENSSKTGVLNATLNEDNKKSTSILDSTEEEKKAKETEKKSFSILTSYHNFDGLYTQFLK